MRRSRSSLAVISSLAWLALAAPRADAQTKPIETLDRDTPWAKGISETSKRAARALLTEGNKLVESGFFAKAVAKYNEALEHWDHPGLHYNLAQAYVHLDQPLAVHESLQKALQYGPKPIGEEKYRQGQAYMKLLETRLARLEITCKEPRAIVALNGKPLFSGPGKRSVVLKAGNHQLVASKPGLLPDSRPIALSPGEKKTIELAPKTLESMRESTRRWAAWKPWALVAAGGAVLLGGGLLHWRSGETYDDFDRQFAALDCAMTGGCATTEGSRDALEPRLDRAGQLQVGAVASYAVGSLAMLAGAYLVYLNRPSFQQNAPEAAQATIEPFITLHAPGLGAQFRF